MTVIIDHSLFFLIDNADTTDRWTGRSPISNIGDGEPGFIEGAGCIDGRLQDGTGDITYEIDAGATDFTDDPMYMWFRPTAPVDTLAGDVSGDPGVTMRVSSDANGAGNYGQWAVGGSDLGLIGIGGWIMYTVDPLRPFDLISGTPPDIDSVFSAGMGGAFLGGPGMAQIVIDAFWIGFKNIIIGGTPGSPGLWDEATTADEEHGKIKSVSGAIFINCRVRFGDSIGVTSTEFSDINGVVFFETNMFMAAHICGFEFEGNSTGTNNAFFGVASGSGVDKIGGSGGVWTVAGDRPFRVEAKDDNMDAIGIFGVSMLGPSALFFDNVRSFTQEDNSAQTFLSFTRAANDPNANDASPFPAGAGVDDAVYFGHDVRWYELDVFVGTAGAGTYTVEWEYGSGPDDGVGLTAEANMAAEAVSVAARGSGYQTPDTITLNSALSPVPATEAIVNVDTLSTVNAQDETAFDGVGSNGTFNGGVSYNVADTITLNDGTIVTVDAVSAGSPQIVTQFTITTPSTSGIGSDGATLTQGATSGVGSGFTLTLGTNNQGVFAVSVNDDGSYQAIPSNPLTQASTSGSGTGATINIDTYTVETVTVTNGGSLFDTAPSIAFSSGAAVAAASLGSPEDSIGSITVTNEGTGYTSVPTISFVNGDIWNALTDLDDDTNAFKNAGSPEFKNVSFAIPDDWVLGSVNGESRYWIRARRDAGTVTTDPDITQVKIGMAGDVELETANAEAIDCVFSGMGAIRIRNGAFLKRSNISGSIATTKHAAIDLGPTGPPADTVRDLTIVNNPVGVLLKGGLNSPDEVEYDFRNFIFAGNGVNVRVDFPATTTVTINILEGGTPLSVTASPTDFDNVNGSTIIVVAAVTVTLTNIEPGTEIRVFPVESPINTTEIAGIESVGSPNTFSFSSTAGLLVDIVIFHIDFVFPPENRLRLTIPDADTEFPITQVIDRNYLNP